MWGGGCELRSAARGLPHDFIGNKSRKLRRNARTQDTTTNACHTMLAMRLCRPSMAAARVSGAEESLREIPDYGAAPQPRHAPRRQRYSLNI